MRNAIVVFTKVPKSGETKTRLTTDKGCILTPDEARQLYEACLLDVIDACVSSNSGDVYICHNIGGDQDYLRQLLGNITDPQAIKGITADEGGTFDQCMQYAADYILRDGGRDRLADSILIVGGDLPTLQSATVREAVTKIEKLSATTAGQAAAKSSGEADAPLGAAIVEGACQEGGFSIIAYTCTTPFYFDGVFYNQDGITALDAVVNKATDNNIPFTMVERVPDLDIPVDLASLIPEINALRLASQYDSSIQMPKRTVQLIQEMGLGSTAAPPQR